MNLDLEYGGSAPTPPRFIAWVSGKAVAHEKRKRRCCAAFPQTRPGAQVASQRCPILPAGKAPSVYHGEVTLEFTPPKVSLTWGTQHCFISPYTILTAPMPFYLIKPSAVRAGDKILPRNGPPIVAAIKAVSVIFVASSGIQRSGNRHARQQAHRPP